jgi:Uma2 family endonuclease
LRKKIEEWMANGAQLAWLINPDNQTVEIYRPNREVEIRTGLKSIAADAPIQGFILDLTYVWKPYGQND